MPRSSAPFVYQTLWGAALPATQQTTPTSFGTTLNHYFSVTAGGFIVGVKYLLANNSKTISGIGFLIDSLNGGNSIVRAAPIKRPPTWTSPPAALWQTAYFHPRYPVVAGQVLRFGFVSAVPFGWYYDDAALLAGDIVNGNLVLLQDTAARHNGLFAQGNGQLILPNTAANGRRFGIDVLFYKP